MFPQKASSEALDLKADNIQFVSGANECHITFDIVNECLYTRLNIKQDELIEFFVEIDVLWIQVLIPNLLQFRPVQFFRFNQGHYVGHTITSPAGLFDAKWAVNTSPSTSGLANLTTTFTYSR